ncbi:MAG: hydrogenase maturation nickel metallochaperone HypA [Chloroflexi bacterium]|nr:hydrogenase maturation nickel metallochaperone HypA [Chloroflexota bacterium]
MHELAVTESIISVVERHAREAQAQRVLRIHLRIGELASIVDDSVQFYFDQLSPGTLAEGAQLVFERLPISLRCRACGHCWQPSAGDWTCPACGASKAALAGGNEFQIDHIEVE